MADQDEISSNSHTTTPQHTHTHPVAWPTLSFDPQIVQFTVCTSAVGTLQFGRTDHPITSQHTHPVSFSLAPLEGEDSVVLGTVGFTVLLYIVHCTAMLHCTALGTLQKITSQHTHTPSDLSYSLAPLEGADSVMASNVCHLKFTRCQAAQNISPCTSFQLGHQAKIATILVVFLQISIELV